MNQVKISHVASVDFTVKEDYLRAVVSNSENSYENAIFYWKRIRDEISAGKHRKLLIVEQLSGSMSVADVFQLVGQIVEMGFVGVKIAFVDTGHRYELGDFGITAGANRGLWGQIFYDEKEAEDWLLSDEK